MSAAFTVLLQNYLAISALLSTSVVTAWALIISHHAGHKKLRAITILFMIPFIFLSLGLQIYKTSLDARQSALQEATLSSINKKEVELQTRETAIANSLDAQSIKAQELFHQTKNISDSLASVQVVIGGVSRYIENSSQELKNLSALTLQNIDAANQNSDTINQAIQDSRDATEAVSRKITADNERVAQEMQARLAAVQLQLNIAHNSPIYGSPQSSDVTTGYGYNYNYGHAVTPGCVGFRNGRFLVPIGC